LIPAAVQLASVLRRNPFIFLLPIEQMGISSLFNTRNTGQLLTFAALNLNEG
jgi:hypothetical protein